MEVSKILYLFLAICYASLAHAEDCTEALMKSLSNSATMAGMIMNTGKYINDLGDYETCESTQGLHYATISLQASPIMNLYLGVWAPVECKLNDLQLFADAVGQALLYPGVHTSVEITKEAGAPVTAGNAIGFVFFSFLVLVAIVGVATEYTNLFNKPDAKEGGKVEESKTKIGLVFLSFSFTRNIRKIFWGPPAKERDYLVIFNGIRVLSLLYVILGHGFLSVLLAPTVDFAGVDRLVYPWPFAIIFGAFYAVDVFFFLSAFLGSYLMLSKFFQKPSMNLPLIYFHRVYRLIFPVGLVIAFVLTFYVYLGDGPIWRRDSQKAVQGCLDQWWQTILFLGNVLPYDNGMQCLGWLWYIANDMQFFILLPFQILAYKKHRYLGYVLAYFILFGCVLTSFILSGVNNLSVNPITGFDALAILYYRPWTRIGSYQVGVIFGMFYYEWMNKDKSRLFEGSFGTKLFQAVQNLTAVRYTFYGVGLVIINGLIIMQHSEGRSFSEPISVYPQFVRNLFNGFSRPLFVLGLFMILMGPLTGRNKFMRWFLGGRGYNPWARISFMTYLIHLLVFQIYYSQMRQAIYPNNKAVMFILCAVILIAMAISVVFSALFEAPFLQLEKLVLFPERPRKTVKELNEGAGCSKFGIQVSGLSTS